MKKRILSVALAMLLCLACLPATVLAENSTMDYSRPPSITSLEIFADGASAWLKIHIEIPASVRSMIDLFSDFDKDYYAGLDMRLSLDGGDWQEMPLSPAGTGGKWNGPWRSDSISGLTFTSWMQICVRFTGKDDDGNPVLSHWSDPLVVNEPEEGPALAPFEFNAHDWAKAELGEADAMGLIPIELRSEDLKQPITRAEFAAVSVRVYEALSGQTAIPAAADPFTDTDDPEVLKAVNLGITNGVSATEFAPDKLLNREQAATMLARVYKKVHFSGWTLETDSDFAEAFRVLFTMPEPFADDGDISSWARDSVYFMAANGIIKGMEGGTFQPRAVTAEQQASGYAQATREQAILIAVRMVRNLQA